jgi:RHS repeat-associated protein
MPFSSASFIYDGDGNRVAQTINNVTTYFVGNYYEVTGSTVTKYYYAGTQRVAMRKGSTLSYLLGDHLGSTSLTLDASGNMVSELRYKAWGEVRYAGGITPTDYTYTGQYSDSYINLLWYGSRHYDPELGCFTSPDSIVPLASQGVQAWDRYAYVNNNPVRYNDPSGHGLCEFLVGLLGISYSCPTDGGDWIEGFDPVHEDIGLEINVPVEEVTDLEGFSRVAEDSGLEVFNPVPEDNGLEVFGPVPEDGLGIIAENDDPYPHVIDPRTGEPIPEPPDGLQIVPKDQRAPWADDGTGRERYEFIKEWRDRGYPVPEGGWKNYDIHHIIPREYGGSNDFWNLVPVERNVHQNELNPWWNRYGRR